MQRSMGGENGRKVLSSQRLVQPKPCLDPKLPEKRMWMAVACMQQRRAYGIAFHKKHCLVRLYR